MKSKLDLLIIVVFIITLISGSFYFYLDNESETIKIANWNLQIFGMKKASNETLLKIYSDIIQEYDIVFVQEIKDKSNVAFPRLCSMLQNYSCVNSSRAGTTNNKEQYGIIYRNGIDLVSFYDFNFDLQDVFERPPIKLEFLVGSENFIIYNIHTKPDNTKNELGFLEDLVDDFGNVIVIGDLNADCSYYNRDREKDFSNWKWIVNDDDDTTSSGSFCAYDRIILNRDANKLYKSYGINKQITKELSDHYLVWVEMKI